MGPIPQKFLMAMLFVLMNAGLGLHSELAPAMAESEPVSRSELDTVKDDLERLKANLMGVQKELELMRQQVLQRSPQVMRPPDVTAQVSVSGNPMLGNPEAPLTVIEFSDYQCPYCRKFVETTLPALKTEYIDTGKIRYIFRDFPLDRLHPQARKAAEAAHCAGDQGKYWQMHDVLFQQQKTLQTEHLKAYARSLDLDLHAFDDCLQQGKYTAEVQKDHEDAVAAGVQGTPSFFLGKTQADDTIQGIFIKGAQPATAFRQVIERLLSEP